MAGTRDRDRLIAGRKRGVARKWHFPLHVATRETTVRDEENPITLANSENQFDSPPVI